MEPTSCAAAFACSRSIRSHYTVLSATRHHRMVEAATFLAANVSLVIGSRNGKTAGRLDSSTLLRIVLFRRAPFCVWKCWGILSPLSFPLASLVFRARQRLSCPLSIYSSTSHLIPRSFVHLPIHLSVRPYVRPYVRPVVQRIPSYIYSSRCALSYYFASIFFARVRSFSFFSPLANARSDARILTLAASSRTRHYDITFLTRE